MFQVALAFWDIKVEEQVPSNCVVVEQVVIWIPEHLWA
jgi:hypothetical protein